MRQSERFVAKNIAQIGRARPPACHRRSFRRLRTRDFPASDFALVRRLTARRPASPFQSSSFPTGSAEPFAQTARRWHRARRGVMRRAYMRRDHQAGAALAIKASTSAAHRAALHHLRRRPGPARPGRRDLWLNGIDAGNRHRRLRVQIALKPQHRADAADLLQPKRGVAGNLLDFAVLVEDAFDHLLDQIIDPLD